MSTLLPFHTSILNEIYDPDTSDLLEEETEIGEELGITGTSRDRQDLYKGGGLIAVTSRILVVELLQNTIPVELITGIMVMHAERVSPLHLVSFITRLYREKNTKGFLKAFTDQPEHITSGLSPLKNIMKGLRLRRVWIYPRFHQEVKDTLERKRADVIELAQNMTDNMNDVHGAIVQCMTITLAELRRSKVELDLDGLNLPAAYFSSFDHIVRKQLDPIWHKVGPSTKALILRRLLGYLLVYDPLQFHSFYQSLVEAVTSNSTESGSGKNQWMLTDAANIVFQAAKKRCFVDVPVQEQPEQTEAIDLDDDDEAWDAVFELEGRALEARPPTNKGKGKATATGRRPKWLPKEIQPGELVRMESTVSSRPVEESPGTNITLVMCSSTATCNLLNDFLSSMNDKRPKEEWGMRMMLKKLQNWFWWEKRRKIMKEAMQNASSSGERVGNSHLETTVWSGESLNDKGDHGLSEAMKKKDRERAAQKASRRRIRGGGALRTVVLGGPPRSELGFGQTMPDDFLNANNEELLSLNDEEMELNLVTDMSTLEFAIEFDEHYGLLAPAQTVLVRAYSDDTDDRMLDEIKPRFIVMTEPCVEFVRRVEVYKCPNPGLPDRVYHMVYANLCEEHKYLAGIRREKDSFERLIKERGSMLLPILEDQRTTENDAIIKTISSRIAGGRRELYVLFSVPRSTLPSLLHASQLLVIPATLTVGDYILTPEICVERKSLSDLEDADRENPAYDIEHRYTQCELMSVHYKTPVLLIEFDEDKAFSFEIISDLKSYAKTTNRYPLKKKTTGNPAEHEYTSPTIQSKFILLTLSFPRLRIIWSSSPYATLTSSTTSKKDRAEPDPVKAVATGAEELDPEAVAGVNAAAEELLRSFPGFTAKNVKHVMNKVKNVRELCKMDLVGVQGILGVEPGKACYDFLHRGEKGFRI
ncbi:hypothetical protein F5050DRAFT_1770584 [Lentinula boryana]|uniref:ERCC4 domain-containing protein n=1 Tax=Lentinula boryana TaxID=40481 RepID=A0ABQ8Q8R8_9AGAR|nr:hypothetical protein F5050DRAFT_1770584 [Lentinula boryana]